MIKGVLFDKDGTIINFSDMWQNSFDAVLADFGFYESINDEIREKVGILKNGEIKENSVIAAGTVSDIANILVNYSSESLEGINKKIEYIFTKYLKENKEKIEATCDLEALFNELQDLGFVIGIVTADSYTQTVYTMEALGQKEKISFIATADKYPNKPSTESLEDFCTKFGLESSEVAMVGDSDIDMLYGKNTGLAIGVLTGVGTEEMLREYTDVVVCSAIDILPILKKYNKI